MRVVVPTCDQYLWAIQPFAYLFNVYWSELQEVLVGGYSPPDFELPPNFTFYQIAEQNYPAEKWSDGLIRLLLSISDDIFVLMLEDYWLTRGVNHQAIGSLGEYMGDRRDILRIDLTADRMYSGHMFDVGAWGYVDLIETPPETPYQWSTQACIVNRKHMLSCLKPGIAPWEFELQGNELIPDGLRVLGTRQYPVRYANAIGMGCKQKYCPGDVPREHLLQMREKGILPLI